MKFEKYFCSMGIARPINPHRQYTNPPDIKIPVKGKTYISKEYIEFDQWVKSLPEIECDSNLDGEYPIRDFKKVSITKIKYIGNVFECGLNCLCENIEDCLYHKTPRTQSIYQKINSK